MTLREKKQNNIFTQLETLMLRLAQKHYRQGFQENILALFFSSAFLYYCTAIFNLLNL